MPKKILLIDDEKDLTDSLAYTLEANNFEVIKAYDGQDGLKKAQAINPDLIILALMLPKLNGYKVCRMLKFDDKYKHIPIIFISARVQESDKKLGEAVKADVYMTKPFEPKELLDKIAELLKNQILTEKKDE